MKLFYATSARVPGSKAHCSQIAQMCRSFRNAGADIELLHPKRAWMPVYGNKTIQEWYGFDEAFPDKLLHCIDLLSKLPHGLPKFVYKLAFNLMVASFNRSLIRHLKSYNDEFVLYTRDKRVFRKLSRELPEIKKIMEFHHLEERVSKAYREESEILDSASGVVVLTSLMKEMLIERGYDGNKIIVESSAVDRKSFPGDVLQLDARKVLKLPDNEKIIAYIGNFHTLGLEKGLDTIVRSVPAVIKKCPDAKFYFIGGPLSYADAYINDLKSNGVDGSHYKFLDRQPYEDIHIWLAASDILVMLLPDHPRFNKNCSPMKIFEYMTSGRPMVMSDLPAFVDVLHHEENAILVPPDNAEAFSAAVLRLLDNPELARNIAERARDDVNRYTWDARASRIVEWISRLN